MNQLGIDHTGPVEHQPYPDLVMNQLGINHTRPTGHQPYPDFVMNQLGINHAGPAGHQPMTVVEICKKVFRQRSGYVKGLGFGPKPISFFKSRCSYFESEVELGKKLIENRLLVVTPQ